jgi:nucleotidyltransferase-like protein
LTIAISERVVAALVDRGAEAVVLVGSRARGDASAHSDVDLAAIGDGPQYRLEIDEGLLVSVGWAPEDEQRRRLYDPSWLGTHVPGWRQAVVLHDPEGLAAEIKHEAVGWDWSQVRTQCDAWVAAWVVGLAEEAHRLATALQDGDTLNAAVQRSVITLRLPQAMALRRRILYGSESHLWDLVARELGPGWRQAQSSALGLGDDDLGASCRSALRLFELAAVEVRELFDDRQLAVVEHALRRSRNA